MTAVPAPTPVIGGTPQLMEITPWLAQQWLGQNVRNRPKKKLAITAYARDMKAGAWLITGEAIKFASDGTLIDGQNRLRAVIAADVPITSWVMFGLDPEVQDVMDAGVKRSNADQLALRDIPNATVVATIAAAWTGLRDGRWPDANGSVGTPQLTHRETLQFVAAHPEVIQAGSIAKATAAHLRLSAGVIGAAWMVMSEIDQRAATTFFQKIREGDFSGKGDPLVTLQRRAQADRDADRASRPAAAFYLIFRTWNAWRAGETLSRLQIQATGGFITMPTPH